MFNDLSKYKKMELPENDGEVKDLIRESKKSNSRKSSSMPAGRFQAIKFSIIGIILSSGLFIIGSFVINAIGAFLGN